MGFLCRCLYRVGPCLADCFDGFFRWHSEFHEQSSGDRACPAKSAATVQEYPPSAGELIPQSGAGADPALLEWLSRDIGVDDRQVMPLQTRGRDGFAKAFDAIFDQLKLFH